MIRIEQTIMHDPPHAYGNCHQAAWAMVLGLGLHQVPHMCNGEAHNLNELERAWLAPLGLVPVYMVFTKEVDWRTLEHYLTEMNPGAPCVVGGTSPRGFGHSVAFYNGQVYDPHPSQKGLVGPHKEDEMWWVTYPVRRLLNG